MTVSLHQQKQRTTTFQAPVVELINPITIGIMTQTGKKIEDLRYRIARYRRMGNGAKCQDLQTELQRLLLQQVAAES